MHDLLPERGQHLFRGRHVGLLPRAQDRERSGFGSSRASGHRCVNEPKPARNGRLRQFSCGHRRNRAHTDDHGALIRGGEHAIWSRVYGFDDRVVGEHRDDEVGVFGRLRGGGRDPSTMISGERLSLTGRAVPYGNIQSRGNEPRRHRRTHPPEAQKTHCGHCTPSYKRLHTCLADPVAESEGPDGQRPTASGAAHDCGVVFPGCGQPENTSA